MEESKKKPVSIFGRDIAEIPCFRNSWLYGISGGIGTGLLCFLFTSKTLMSTNVGFSGIVGITLSYWSYCRYDLYRKVTELEKMKEYVEKKALLEGTEMEKIVEVEVAEV